MDTPELKSSLSKDLHSKQRQVTDLQTVKQSWVGWILLPFLHHSYQLTHSSNSYIIRRSRAYLSRRNHQRKKSEKVKSFSQDVIILTGFGRKIWSRLTNSSKWGQEAEAQKLGLNTPFISFFFLVFSLLADVKYKNENTLYLPSDLLPFSKDGLGTSYTPSSQLLDCSFLGSTPDLINPSLWQMVRDSASLTHCPGSSLAQPSLRTRDPDRQPSTWASILINFLTSERECKPFWHV